MLRTFLILAASFGLGSSATADKLATMPPAEITRIAKDAYIFSFPLVMNYRTMHAQAIAQGGFGEWLHLGTSSPADTDIVTPNNDTPYSYAWLDLRAEPWVLTMPEIEEERYYTSQWDDLWGYVLDNPGSVNDGNKGHSFLLAAPGWRGEVPKDVKRVIKGESSFLGSLTRTQMLSAMGGMDRVQEIQQSYLLQPLSSFAGTPVPEAAPTVAWPTWNEGDETTLAFFDYVEFLLPFTTPHPDDAAVYDEMAQIGLGDGKMLDSEALNQTTLDAMQAGIDAARAELQSLSEQSFDPALFFNTREIVGTDYISRAMGVFVGIFGNTTDQAVYFTLPTDANGELTDGSKADYTVTFEAGNLPPVEYFWSYTMYRLPERLLVDNPLDRYSIGSSTEGLMTNEDGSLTLYFSKESPGADKESNWLPAPDGPFWAVLRTYGPSADIRDGKWTQPAFVPVNK
ncbi:DUF1254 domain-containing protein [Ruegeria sediminis]|uniref:DUF1254 domain-containing protein n=1 Tax=Ruegeria sediminis TaxID=2583820 RepID=A0ABY2X4W3_9RHOB|nr:DUF1214 domain-containing protein [Ruegeria sediminis]TMV10095.1 DUF1254 domain-containing protein [Ruegeria sediminis]